MAAMVGLTSATSLPFWSRDRLMAVGRHFGQLQWAAVGSLAALAPSVGLLGFAIWAGDIWAFKIMGCLWAFMLSWATSFFWPIVIMIWMDWVFMAQFHSFF